MGEDGEEVLAVSLYLDELFVGAAVVGRVVGAKENGLRRGYEWSERGQKKEESTRYSTPGEVAGEGKT